MERLLSAGENGYMLFSSMAFAFDFSASILHSALSGGNITPSEQENLHFFMPCNAAIH